jgi:hypothetical protein
VLAEKDVEADYVLLFVRLYQVLTYTILAFTTLSILHVPLTAFAFVSGALAIGVGFGAQNIHHSTQPAAFLRVAQSTISPCKQTMRGLSCQSMRP